MEALDGPSSLSGRADAPIALSDKDAKVCVRQYQRAAHEISHAVAVGADVEWFKLHDVGRRASGEVEAAVCLAVACVDIDKRRAIYDLPLAVAPEKRVTKGQLEK